MTRKIIGLCGWIGSGKDTVADYLVREKNFTRVSWAGALKDAVANVFGWDREALEGLTPESRAWREQVDTWWAKRLAMPHLTPRWVLQFWGTEVCRIGFHSDIWIASVENKLLNSANNIVISDCRFPNEIQSITNSGGETWWITRGDLPDWYMTAYRENTMDVGSHYVLEDHGKLMTQMHPEIHHSEWAWVGSNFDLVLENNGTLDDLYYNIDQRIKD
jgi:hypothetical protein